MRTIEKARTHLWDDCKDLTDEEVQNLLDYMQLVCKIAWKRMEENENDYSND